MNLTATQIAALAGHVEQAELERRPIAKITDAHPQMDWDDAYAIQEAIRARKVARGTRIAGLKMGLTSRAKMKQMGVEVPVYGFITDYGCVPDGGEVRMDELIHPRIEAEVAFVTKAALQGPGCHVGAVLAATDYVVPAIEVIDSRYEHFRFDLKSVVADNTSAARYAVGSTAREPGELDLRHLGVVIEKNGRVVATAAGAAVLGHPAASVAMLANLLGARGQHIPAGTLILTGGITEAIAVERGDTLTARYQGLGSVGLNFI